MVAPGTVFVAATATAVVFASVTATDGAAAGWAALVNAFATGQSCLGEERGVCHCMDVVAELARAWGMQLVSVGVGAVDPGGAAAVASASCVY